MNAPLWPDEDPNLTPDLTDDEAAEAELLREQAAEAIVDARNEDCDDDY